MNEIMNNTINQQTAPAKRPTYSLYAIDITPWVEQKPAGGGKSLSYLSWAAAWHIVRRFFPDAVYEVIKAPDGRLFWADPTGYVVGVRLTLNGGETYETWLPVMDSNNNSMRGEGYSYTTKFGEKQVPAADMRDITDAIRRCLVKVIAESTGLGLCLWVPQGLPQV